MASSLVDEVEISKVDDRVEKIGSDEHRVHLPDRISQKDQSPSQAEIPEGHRNHTFLPFLRGDPLDYKPHGKHGLTGKTEEDPEVQLKFGIPDRQTLKKIGDEPEK
jgi:hypothetical protein